MCKRYITPSYSSLLAYSLHKIAFKKLEKIVVSDQVGVFEWPISNKCAYLL